MKELLLGCGSRTVKDIYLNGKKDFDNVVRLDINPGHKPDIVHDLTKHPLPFKDNEFDEIHCYEVLEHLAQQGDYKFFFREFSEYWRVLKPDGMFCASVPYYPSTWSWGDPGHKRVINEGTLVFLDQDEYQKQIGKTTMSDYRNIYKAHFKRTFVQVNKTKTSLLFALRAVKNGTSQ